MKNIIKNIKQLSLEEITELKREIQRIEDKKYKDLYYLVEILSDEGNVSEWVGRESGFQTHYGAGSIYVSIPRKEYSKKEIALIKTELLNKYDKRFNTKYKMYS